MLKERDKKESKEEGRRGGRRERGRKGISEAGPKEMRGEKVKSD